MTASLSRGRVAIAVAVRRPSFFVLIVLAFCLLVYARFASSALMRASRAAFWA